MIKNFENFNKEDSFEELKEFFLEMIDDGAYFERWDPSTDLDGAPRGYIEESLIKNFERNFSELQFVKIIIKMEGISNWENRLQSFLNRHKFGIINLVPQLVDISYIDYKKFFNSEGLQFIERVSGFKLTYVSKFRYDEGEERRHIGMVFAR
jgi:hypothetical protein